MKLLTRFQRREKRATIAVKEDSETTQESVCYVSIVDQKVLSKRPVNMKDYMKGLGAGLIISVVIIVLYYVLWLLAK